MLSVKEIIVVEGRYDKAAVSNAVDATVITTEGFGIFSDKEKLNLIKTLAEKRGVIILTDSDGGGFLIRSKLKGMLNGLDVKHAYIPDVYGKEKRKLKRSKEGKIGVEGIDPKLIEAAIINCGATENDGSACKTDKITKADLYEAGLSGGENSAEKRRELTAKLGLPERISPNSLLDVLNIMLTKEEFEHLTAER